jgi:hypothetical protein
MGCDIHAYAEYKINDRWEHIKEVNIHRNYELFSRLVDGHPRGNEKGIAPARGLPEDINPMTSYLIEKSAEHTFSYLTGIELKALDDDTDDKYNFITDCEYNYNFGYDEIFSDNFRLVFGFDS